ncbi:hypothetical protein [Aquimarina sp. 2201CG5-10]|uniref:hypothetical protein n=1 Tax=Aquimarina callyspongiae TaxID=3098150 RepID=UPI002AB4B7E7|nr:hypothetical protein [Aquimarina sp. 2201CG5-10]MDY8138850.1 hypothetical protein [Aquimarina sp. 2201CG5-10]
MKKYKFVIIIIVFCSLNIGCNSCDEVQGIKISELLSRQIDDSYCETLENAIKLDKEAIIKVSTYKISDAAGYDHGYVLVSLIEKIGEQEYLKAIESVSTEQKQHIESYLWAGIDYGVNKIYKFKKLEELLPELAKFLKNRQNHQLTK